MSNIRIIYGDGREKTITNVAAFAYLPRGDDVPEGPVEFNTYWAISLIEEGLEFCRLPADCDVSKIQAEAKRLYKKWFKLGI